MQSQSGHHVHSPFCHVGQDIRNPSSDAQNWHSSFQTISFTKIVFSFQMGLQLRHSLHHFQIQRCESATSPLKQNFHICPPQKHSRRTPTFRFSHKSWSATSKSGHMHWSRTAPSASTKVTSPLEGPSPGLEALGTLDIHIHDLLSFSAFSIRSKRFLKCAFKDDPFTRASFAD